MPKRLHPTAGLHSKKLHEGPRRVSEQGRHVTGPLWEKDLREQRGGSSTFIDKIIKSILRIHIRRMNYLGLPDGTGKEVQ